MERDNRVVVTPFSKALLSYSKRLFIFYNIYIPHGQLVYTSW